MLFVRHSFCAILMCDIVLYETEKGKGANGWYDRETNTVYLDIFSGGKGEQAMLRTFSHELTHYMQEQSPESYDRYKSFILDYYYGKDDGILLERLLEQERRLAPNKNREYWEDEVVANASEMFLNDEEAMRTLIGKQPGTAKVVDQWLKRMTYALRRAFKGVNATEEAAKELEANIEYFEKAQKLWNELLKESIENSQGSATSEESKTVQFSMRGKNAEGIEVYETSDKIKNLTIKERQKAFLDVIVNQYQGRTAKFVRNGHTYYATFERNDVNKNIYGDRLSDKKGWKAKINVGADGDIFELVENSQYDGSKPESGKPTASHQGVGYWDYFIKTVQIDDTVYDLTANIRKKQNGNFVYSIQLNQNKKIKASPPLDSHFSSLIGVTNALQSQYIQNGTKSQEVSEKNSLENIDPIKIVERHGKSRTNTTAHSVHQKSEDVNTQFSMRKPVEETKDLIAVHNTSESKLESTLKLGGFPMPSIAIVKAEQGHSEFGDISVVFGKDTIDPKFIKSNEVKFSRRANIYDYTKSFEEQIDDYKKGLIPKTDTLLVGATPEVWQKIGFNALPVTINQTHIGYALNNTKDTDHSIGEALLKDLPNQIKNPVAIIQSQSPGHSDRAVVVMEMTHNGKPVVSAVEIDGHGVTNNIRIDSNAMTTLFAKNNILKQLNAAINNTINGKTELFYWNKKETSALLQRSGLQLPGWLPQDGFVHSITEQGSKVNPKFSNVTETQQFKRWFGDWQNNPKKASKAVSENGEPMVLYHGTAVKGIEAFDISKAKDGALGKGFYFSESEDYADGFTYANGKKTGEVIEAYLNIRNPYIAPYPGGIDTDDLKAKGYDGVYNPPTGFWVAFEPTQVKSTENIGTFDKDNGNIRFSSRKNDNSAVGFDEVKAVVLPDNASEKLKQSLSNAGINFVEYSAGDSGSRLDALNSLENVKFSKRKNFDKALTSDEWKKYNHSMTSRMDAGLRINDHAMLVECESGEYSYKLVIYDNTLPGNPINAIYAILGRQDPNAERNFYERDVAEFICKSENKYGNGQMLQKSLKAYVQFCGYIFRRYSSESDKFYQYGRKVRNNAETIRQELAGKGVRQGAGEAGWITDLFENQAKYQLRKEDENRLYVLERQEERLTNDLKILEKAYGKVIRQEYEQNIKPNDKMSRRAAEINRKAANRFMNEVGAVFHVAKEDRRIYLLPIINEIIDKGPTISDSRGLIENLYRTAYERSSEYAVGISDKEYDELRKYIKKTAVFVDAGTRADVGDYGSFVKNNFGRLRLTKDATALGLDEFYDELRSIAPEDKLHSESQEASTFYSGSFSACLYFSIKCRCFF